MKEYLKKKKKQNIFILLLTIILFLSLFLFEAKTERKNIGEYIVVKIYDSKNIQEISELTSMYSNSYEVFLEQDY